MVGAAPKLGPSPIAGEWETHRKFDKIMSVAQGAILKMNEYQSQVEKVVETLKKDLPPLFERDISYEIYTNDILFKDPVNKFKGKLSYRVVYWTLRFHGQLFFTEIYLDLHDVQQTAQDTVEANWRVRGTLRLPWTPGIFFNGNSNYKLNEDGLIYQHIDTWDREPIEVLKQFFRKGKNGEENQALPKE